MNSLIVIYGEPISAERLHELINIKFMNESEKVQINYLKLLDNLDLNINKAFPTLTALNLLFILYCISDISELSLEEHHKKCQKLIISDEAILKGLKNHLGGYKGNSAGFYYASPLSETDQYTFWGFF